MNEPHRAIEIQSLSFQDIPNLSYDSTGQLILARSEEVRAKKSIKKLSIQREAHVKAVIYWLQLYQPIDSSDFEQVKKYIEAFHHLCKIEAWQEAYQLFSLNIPPSSCTIYESLGLWGYYREQIEMGNCLLNKINSEVDYLCLLELATAHRELGEFSQAFNFYQKILYLLEPINNYNFSRICKIYSGLGSTNYYMGNLKLSIYYHEKQLYISKKIKSKIEMFNAMLNLGRCWFFLGVSKKANYYFDRVISEIDDIDKIFDPTIKSDLYSSIGMFYMVRGRFHDAIDYLQKSLSYSHTKNSRPLQASTLGSLGLAQVKIGFVREGIENLHQSLAVNNSIGTFYGEVYILNNIMVTYQYFLKDHRTAFSYLLKALKIADILGNSIIKSYFLTHLSYYYVCEKNYPLAVENAYQVLTIAREAQNKPSLALGFAMIAYTYWSMGKFIKSLFFLARSLIIQPPWHGANGQIIWQKFVELLKNKFTVRGSDSDNLNGESENDNGYGES